MKYLRILLAFGGEPLAIQREKLAAITDFLLFKAAGGELSAEEVAARITKKRDAEITEKPGSVALIPVYGVLAQRMDMFMDISGGTSYSSLRQMLHTAIASDEVKAVVLDVDSPGGTVPGTEELAAEIRALRGGDKPIIAQVNSLAASAAYWIASAADEIVVTPSGRAGSIGVYTAHDDVSEFLKQRGVKRTYLAAGKYKVEGNEAEPLGEDARAHIMELVEQSYRRFVGAVAEGRGVTKSRVEDSYGQGRIFGAEALVERGMVDRIGTLEQTLARFGAATEPEVIRRVKAANAANAQAAEVLGARIRAGEMFTKREFEHGLKGIFGLSNSEAERAARLYFKDGQGEPDDAADKAALAALNKVLAQAKAF
jgi:signal peptide peptidase SppA